MIKNDKQFNIYFLLWYALYSCPCSSYDLNNFCDWLNRELRDYLMFYGYSYNQKKLHDLDDFINLYEKEEIL